MSFINSKKPYKPGCKSGTVQSIHKIERDKITFLLDEHPDRLNAYIAGWSVYHDICLMWDERSDWIQEYADGFQIHFTPKAIKDFVTRGQIFLALAEDCHE